MTAKKRRFKLRGLEVDRIDTVDRGANQHAHIVIAKGYSDGKDEEGEARDAFIEAIRRRKKKMGGSAFPEKAAADVSKAFPPPAAAGPPANAPAKKKKKPPWLADEEEGAEEEAAPAEGGEAPPKKKEGGKPPFAEAAAAGGKLAEAQPAAAPGAVPPPVVPGAPPMPAPVGPPAGMAPGASGVPGMPAPVPLPAAGMPMPRPPMPAMPAMPGAMPMPAMAPPPAPSGLAGGQMPGMPMPGMPGAMPGMPMPGMMPGMPMPGQPMGMGMPMGMPRTSGDLAAMWANYQSAMMKKRLEVDDGDPKAEGVEKHYPGQHDQANHGNRSGSRRPSRMTGDIMGRPLVGEREAADARRGERMENRREALAQIDAEANRLDIDPDEYNAYRDRRFKEITGRKYMGGIPDIGDSRKLFHPPGADIGRIRSDEAPPTTKSGHRPISTIAREIRREWGPKVNYAAKPYLDAMGSLDDITDRYYEDDAKSVVAYFLSNASSWRGQKAKDIKIELRGILSKASNPLGRAT